MPHIGSERRTPDHLLINIKVDNIAWSSSELDIAEMILEEDKLMFVI